MKKHIRKQATNRSKPNGASKTTQNRKVLRMMDPLLLVVSNHHDPM